MRCSPLKEKIVAKISSWTIKKLTYEGRLQLIQSVLFGIQAYWAQVIIIPAKVCQLIEAYCQSYIWARTNDITKRALVAWERICSQKSVGRLNIINLQVCNKAAIVKLCWDMVTKKVIMLIKWIHTYYIKNKQFQEYNIPQQATWMIRRYL